MTDTAQIGDAPAQRPPRPRTVNAAAGLLLVAAVGVVAAAGSLFGLKGWLADSVRTNAAKTHSPVPADLPKYVSSVCTSQLIVAVVMAVMLSLVAVLALRGRPWVRWAALALYVLASITGSLIGISAILSVGSPVPNAFKIPTFVAGVAFLAAVILLNLRSSTKWLSFGRPAPAAGRVGLFGPRPATRPAGADGARRPAGNGLFGGGLLGGGGLLARPTAPPTTVVDVEPVSVETTSSRPEPKTRGATAAGASGAGSAAGATGATAAAKNTTNRPAARSKGGAKSRRS